MSNSLDQDDLLLIARALRSYKKTLRARMRSAKKRGASIANGGFARQLAEVSRVGTLYEKLERMHYAKDGG